MRIVSGTTGEKIYFVAFSTADHVTRVTGLTSFNTYLSVAGSTGTVGATTALEINSTQMAGIYAYTITDSTVFTLGAGVDSREVCLHITSSMDPVTRTFEVYRRTATTGQTIAVDSSGAANADVKEFGGTTVTGRDIGASVLLSSGTGAGQIVLTSGLVSANMTQLAGQAQTSRDLGADSLTIINRVTSIETNTTGLVTRLSSVNTNVDSILSKATSIETNTTGLVTRLSSVNTNVDTALTRLSSIDTKATAIQAQTTQLTFTVANMLDANIQYVNDTAVQGTGTTSDTWRPV